MYLQSKMNDSLGSSSKLTPVETVSSSSSQPPPPHNHPRRKGIGRVKGHARIVSLGEPEPNQKRKRGGQHPGSGADGQFKRPGNRGVFSESLSKDKTFKPGNLGSSITDFIPQFSSCYKRFILLITGPSYSPAASNYDEMMKPAPVPAPVPSPMPPPPSWGQNMKEEKYRDERYDERDRYRDDRERYGRDDRERYKEERYDRDERDRYRDDRYRDDRRDRRDRDKERYRDDRRRERSRSRSRSKASHRSRHDYDRSKDRDKSSRDKNDKIDLKDWTQPPSQQTVDPSLLSLKVKMRAKEEEANREDELRNRWVTKEIEPTPQPEMPKINEQPLPKNRSSIKMSWGQETRKTPDPLSSSTRHHSVVRDIIQDVADDVVDKIDLDKETVAFSCSDIRYRPDSEKGTDGRTKETALSLFIFSRPSNCVTKFIKKIREIRRRSSFEQFCESDEVVRLDYIFNKEVDRKNFQKKVEDLPRHRDLVMVIQSVPEELLLHREEPVLSEEELLLICNDNLSENSFRGFGIRLLEDNNVFSFEFESHAKLNMFLTISMGFRDAFFGVLRKRADDVSLKLKKLRKHRKNYYPLRVKVAGNLSDLGSKYCFKIITKNYDIPNKFVTVDFKKKADLYKFVTVEGVDFVFNTKSTFN